MKYHKMQQINAACLVQQQKSSPYWFPDDLQLQMSAPSNEISELLHSMQSCISDVKNGLVWACLNLTSIGQNSCLSPQKELSISTTYIHQSLLVTLIFPSNNQWSILVFNWTVITLWMNMSPLLLRYATLNYVVWHLFVDSWEIWQLPHLCLILPCLELITVTHFCLVLLIMSHPTCNRYRTNQLMSSRTFQNQLTWSLI